MDIKKKQLRKRAVDEKYASAGVLVRDVLLKHMDPKKPLESVPSHNTLVCNLPIILKYKVFIVC